MECILAIDLGTTNLKIIAFDLAGSLLKNYSVSVETLNPSKGYYEQDPEAIWQSLKTGLENISRELEIRCLVMSGAMHSIFAVDNDGTPLCNALLWSDLRSSKLAGQLKNSEQGNRFYHETGTPIHSMSCFPKLLWFKKEQPELYNKAHKFISIKEYCIFQLTGEYVIDKSLASTTGLLDIHQLKWSGSVLDLLQIDDSRLSALANATDIVSIDFKPLTGIPLVCGGADGCLANLGSGVLNSESGTITIGTSSAIRTTTKQPQTTKAQSTFCYFLDDHFYVPGGSSNNGGNVYQWLQNHYGNFGDKQIEKIPIGAARLTAIPYLFDERAPYYQTGKTARLDGLTENHTKHHVIRAFMEGICYNLHLIGESLDPFDEIVASGGFTASNLWVQMLADIFMKPVRLLSTTENSALGAAFVGMKAINLISHYDETLQFLETSEILYPDAKNNIKYLEAFQRFKILSEY